MKFRKWMFVIFMVLVLGACGNKEVDDSGSDKYYQDTQLKKFETFTSVTGIELSGTQNKEGGEYGIPSLIKDGTYRLVISEAHPKEDVVMYSVFVPTKTIQELEEESAQQEENLNGQREDEYGQFEELCKAGKYEEAVDFFIKVIFPGRSIFF